MNLNAGHLPLLVNLMLTLCRAGVQLVLTTHSLFLLRELVIQLAEEQNKGTTRRFFGLQAGRVEGPRVSEADELDKLAHLDSLEAEQEQADRYLGLMPQLSDDI